MIYPRRQVWLILCAAVLTVALLESVKEIFFRSLPNLPFCITTVTVVGSATILLCRYALLGNNTVVAEIEVPPKVADETGRLLAAVLASLRDGVVVVNSQMNIVLYNDAATRILRLRLPNLGTAEVSRQGAARLPRLIDATRDPVIHATFDQALSERMAIDTQVELVGREMQSYQLSVVPLGVDLAVGVFFDITDLERLERVRREFFANLSHELRTPLTTIIACAETLLDGALDDPENNTRFLEKLYKHAVWMSRLISDISDLSAIESGGLKLKLCPVTLSEVVSEAMTLVESRALAMNVAFTLRVPAALQVRADRTRLVQVLYNLIDNAVKFNRSGGAVTITAEDGGRRAIIQIADTGAGIPAADLSRVFERLYRGDKSRSRRVEGTGLGLAIVKHLMQAHGGEVTLTSEVGRGSTFTFDLPVASCQSVAPADSPGAERSGAESK